MKSIDVCSYRKQGRTPDRDGGGAKTGRAKMDQAELAETIDWNLVWIEKQRRCTESGWGRECWQTWEDEAAAQEYLDMTRSRPVSRQRIDDICSLVRPDWRVLDIGAGPGNIAIPLSALCSHVSAVEPAHGMALILNKQLQTAKINNVHLVNKKWDDVIPSRDLSPPYDLSFASFSLGMNDIRTSIVKTAGTAARFCRSGNDRRPGRGAFRHPPKRLSPPAPSRRGQTFYPALFSPSGCWTRQRPGP